jgi:hypothetical protein
MKGTSLLTPKEFLYVSPPHCSGVTEIWHMVHTAHALHAVQIRLKSVSNEGHFTLEGERVFGQYLPSHCHRMTGKCHMALPAHALQAVKVRLKSDSNEGHFTLEAENFFVRMSSRIAVGD